MSKSTVFVRQYVKGHQTRHVSSSSAPRSFTSPQRRNVATPAVAARLKPFTDIPGPLALPMLRHSAHVLPRIGNFHHTVGLGLLEGLRNRYGDIVRLAKASRKRPVLYLFDPEMMRQVYDSGLTEIPYWEMSPLTRQRENSGHFHLQSDETKAVFAGMKTLLQDGVLMKSFEKVFDEISAEATRRLGDLRNAENALNEEVETEMYRWALEIMGAMLFGIRLGALDGPTHKPSDDNRQPQKTSLDDDISDACSLFKRSPDDMTAAERLVRCIKEIAEGSYMVRSDDTMKSESQTFNHALKAMDRHFNLTEHFLKQALEQLNTENRKPEQILIERLQPLQDRILPLAADLLLAGIEPLVHSTISMLYHLALNAVRQQQAHDQICWAAASTHAGAGTPQLTYLRACATEALRLHPVTGGVVRRSKGSLEISGYLVPAGVDIVLAHGVTSKGDKEWGRGKAFIPDRWSNQGWEPLKASRAHPLATLPFGQRCPASGIIENILATLATRVLEKYRIEWHGPAPNMETTGVNKLQRPYYFVLQNAA